MKTLMKFVRDEDGLTTVEYAVAGALVAAAVALAFQGLGDAVTALSLIHISEPTRPY